MDDNGDSGWIKGLPEGWVDGFICGRRHYARLKMEFADADPAPWYEPANPDFWGPHFGNKPEDHTRSEKLAERLVCAFQHALSTGKLCASLFNDGIFRELPKAAFKSKSALRSALQLGALDLDPLWPDDWDEWSGSGWAVPKAQFERWLNSRDAMSMEGLPVQEFLGAVGDVLPIAERLPSEGAHVSLSEAVSWIAFGLALHAGRLDRAIHWGKLCGGDLQAAQRQIEESATALLNAGVNGRVQFIGRHVKSYNEKGARTEPILSLALVDYRQILITGYDQLHYGEGLKRWYRAINNSNLRGSERTDYFENVAVNRAELLQNFPPSAVTIERADSQDDFGPIYWDDFEPESFPRLQELSAVAGQAEWWTWPEAVAWIGSRDVRNIATLRFHAIEWSERGVRDATLTLATQSWLAEHYCESPKEAKAKLLNAIERAEVCTSGRLAKGAAATDLSPRIWRGGKIIWQDGEAVLVDGKQLLTIWAFDIAVRRVDLLCAFPERVDSPVGSDGNRQYLGGPTWVDLAYDPAFAPVPDSSNRPLRAPSVKANRAPSIEAILAKADEMKARGIEGRTIARTMRLEPGFDQVATTSVRDLIHGRWPRGRPKKTA